ncbi:hypothetical protein ElyMa_006202000 [Elysia marginata]|uniref:Uncharacterized protein n=1 Tax=Elysia marginata TaxID=1093978 RepID=A0AAV4H2Q2_9GAST|nr:hypothetical protein ElyMa_006202000 [Elysia marginata]
MQRLQPVSHRGNNNRRIRLKMVCVEQKLDSHWARARVTTESLSGETDNGNWSTVWMSASSIKIIGTQKRQVFQDHLEEDSGDVINNHGAPRRR